MKGLGTFVGIIIIIILAAVLLGMCCIGVFAAPDLWMKIVCFAIVLIMVAGVTLLSAAFAASNTDHKQ